MRLKSILFIVVLYTIILSGWSSSSSAQAAEHVLVQSQQSAQGAAHFSSITASVKLLLCNLRKLLESFIQSIHNGIPKWFISNNSNGSRNSSLGNSYGSLEWNGVRATMREKASLDFIKTTMAAELAKGTLTSTTWLQGVTDKELLRFLRHHNGHQEAAWKSIKAHSVWRTGPSGCETIMKQDNDKYAKSVLNREIFWLGLSYSGCPTLVIRTQAHEGSDYGEDPKAFTSFFVWMLEQGRIKYKAGQDVPICVILDRGAFYRNGKRKGDKPDFSVVPRLVDLFSTLFSVVNSNYPEILATAKVVPVSFFFKMCYRVTSRVMDKKARDKFILLPGHLVAKDLLGMFPASILPPHMGGTSTKGGFWDDGQWDRPDAIKESLAVLHDSGMENKVGDGRGAEGKGSDGKMKGSIKGGTSSQAVQGRLDAGLALNRISENSGAGNGKNLDLIDDTR